MVGAREGIFINYISTRCDDNNSRDYLFAILLENLLVRVRIRELHGGIVKKY